MIICNKPSLFDQGDFLSYGLKQGILGRRKGNVLVGDTVTVRKREEYV